VLALFAGINRR